MYTVGQLAKMTGITIRTLHYYDEKGLLSPAHKDEHGHRFYDTSSIVTLQQINMFKYLGYTLKDIQTMLQQPKPLVETLQQQYEALLEKRTQLDQTIATMETTIAIQQRTKSVDTASLLVVMQSILTIDEQKAFLQRFLPKPLIDNMYNYLNENIVSLNERYLKLTYELKDVYRLGADDDVLKQLIADYFLLIPPELAQQIAYYMEDVQAEELNDWLFTSLFTPDEEEWLIAMVEKFSLQEELFI